MGKSPKMSLSIVLPTYNESENLKKLIPLLKKRFSEAEILVVDDKSPDKTAETARTLGARVIVREKKEGIGAALREGYNHAKGNIIVSMDADCSISVEDVPRLLEKLKSCDIAVGSKYSKGSTAEGFNSKAQKFFSIAGNKLFIWFFKLPVDDVTLNFRAFSKGTWKRLDLSEKTNVFFLEMLVKSKLKGLRIGQIPINFSKRYYGLSKTSILKLVPLYLKFLFKNFFKGLK